MPEAVFTQKFGQWCPRLKKTGSADQSQRPTSRRSIANDRAVGPGSCALAEIADSCSNFCNGSAMRF